MNLSGKVLRSRYALDLTPCLTIGPSMASMHLGVRPSGLQTQLWARARVAIAVFDCATVEDASECLQRLLTVFI